MLTRASDPAPWKLAPTDATPLPRPPLNDVSAVTSPTSCVRCASSIPSASASTRTSCVLRRATVIVESTGAVMTSATALTDTDTKSSHVLPSDATAPNTAPATVPHTPHPSVPPSSPPRVSVDLPEPCIPVVTIAQLVPSVTDAAAASKNPVPFAHSPAFAVNKTRRHSSCPYGYKNKLTALNMRRVRLLERRLWPRQCRFDTSVF